jgi:vesicle coat complex subunit
MSAVNVLLQHGLVSRTLPENHHFRTVLVRKLSSPLISMLSAPPNPPEIQYAALRNVILILQKFPKLFGSDIKVFFCNYNDPQYIKLEKLEALGLVVDDQSIDRILPELLEYAKDVDGRFARKSIKIMAKCALNAPRWSSRIAEVFAELLQIDRPEIAQQITISLVGLLRSEDCFSSFLHLLKSCYFADLLNAYEILQADAEALAAFAWILGAFLNESSLGLESEEIECGLHVFAQLFDRFALEPMALQEQIVLAALKMFLLNRQQQHANVVRFKEQATEALNLGAAKGEAVDLQDRCRMYSLLLQNEPLKAQTLAPSSLDPFSTFSAEAEAEATVAFAQASSTNETPLERLLLNDSVPAASSNETQMPLESFPYQLGSIASVLHLPPLEFVSARQIVDSFEASASMASLPEALMRLMRNERPALTNLLDLQSASPSLKTPAAANQKPLGISEKYANLLDLLD